MFDGGGILGQKLQTALQPLVPLPLHHEVAQAE
jgi:hypothetical protein